jgi:hypothetical protein
MAISYTITTAKGGMLGTSNTCTGRTASERLVYGSNVMVGLDFYLDFLNLLFLQRQHRARGGGL